MHIISSFLILVLQVYLIHHLKGMLIKHTEVWRVLACDVLPLGMCVAVCHTTMTAIQHDYRAFIPLQNQVLQIFMTGY